MLSDKQQSELGGAKRAFEEVRPFGWQDAEAAHSKDNSLAYEASTGVTGGRRPCSLPGNRAAHGMRRVCPARRLLAQANRAVEQKYAAGDYSDYHAARSEMSNMAKSLERGPQLESVLENRKRELGIDLESVRSLGRALAFTHGLDLGRGRGIEL